MRRTVVGGGDRRFDNLLSGSHHQSQVSLESDDDFRSGCRKVSHHHRQQSFSGLHSTGRSNYTITLSGLCQFLFFYQTQNELTQNKGNLKPTYEHTQVDPTYHRVSGAQWQSIRARNPKV